MYFLRINIAAELCSSHEAQRLLCFCSVKYVETCDLYLQLSYCCKKRGVGHDINSSLRVTSSAFLTEFCFLSKLQLTNRDVEVTIRSNGEVFALFGRIDSKAVDSYSIPIGVK